MEAEKLSISLPKDMAEMVRRQVETGIYASNSEVIRDALRLWEERGQAREQRLDDIRARIDEAARSSERITGEEMRRYFERLVVEAEKRQSK